MDLDLKIPCHMDGSISWYFLMMDTMSPDGLWDCDEVNGRRKLWRLENMTFKGLTELQEKSRNAAHRSAIMHSGNEWLEPTGSQPGMDHGQR